MEMIVEFSNHKTFNHFISSFHLISFHQAFMPDFVFVGAVLDILTFIVIEGNMN